MLKHIFRDKTYNRKLLALTLPISMQNLMLALVAAADAVVLGKLKSLPDHSMNFDESPRAVLFSWLNTGAKKIPECLAKFSVSVSANQ